jgi:hypothetical protein
VTVIEADELFVTLLASDVLLAGGFDAPDDADGDGHGDNADNCVRTVNFQQRDDGGILTLSPDEIGNACQCGDGEAANNGSVFPTDVEACQDALIGAESDPEALVRCSVTGGREVDIEDLVVLQQATAGEPGAEIESVCQPFVGD